MEAERFETVLMQLAQSRTRREAVRRLGAAALGLGGLSLLAGSTDARRKKKRKGGKRGKGGKGGKGGGGGGGGLPLGAICEAGTDACAGNLECDTPTTQHQCSSTVQDVDTWCCVPPGGACTQCECCGNYKCDFGAANPDGACIPDD